MNLIQEILHLLNRKRCCRIRVWKTSMFIKLTSWNRSLESGDFAWSLLHDFNAIHRKLPFWKSNVCYLQTHLYVGGLTRTGTKLIIRRLQYLQPFFFFRNFATCVYAKRLARQKYYRLKNSFHPLLDGML